MYAGSNKKTVADEKVDACNISLDSSVQGKRSIADTSLLCESRKLFVMVDTAMRRSAPERNTICFTMVICHTKDTLDTGDLTS